MSNPQSRRRARQRRIQADLAAAGTPALAAYWEARYASGRDSGAGSSGAAAAAKAAYINHLIHTERIASVVDWGCGDGQQLAHLDAPAYLGIDIAPTAVRQSLHRHPGRAFMVWPTGLDITVHAELALSLDVVFHLVEDTDYEAYLERLFASASRFVAIHSTDMDTAPSGHMRHRRHTAHAPAGWVLADRAPDPERPGFYLWRRT